MRNLSYEEISNVSGADFDGALIGLFDGAATGMSIGGKWGGAGGWGWGGLAQLVGIIVPTIFGTIAGFAGGAISDRATIMATLADYCVQFSPGNVNHGGTIG